MKNLAIFDLDHTLINTDSDNAFPQFLIEKGLLDAEQAAAKNAQFYQGY
ncbi:HAD-IB family hydrolase, partial [Kingella kingae]|nr:HAD-IB family hydrolase [Kingella kingae]